MRNIFFIAVLALVLMFFLPSCAKEKTGNGVSFEIDRAKISDAASVETRLESFRNLLNAKTEGFSKAFTFYGENEKVVGYILMIYTDADEMTGIKTKIVIGQIFWHTFRSVAPDAESVGIYIITPDLRQIALEMRKEKINDFRNAKPSDWEKYVESPILFVPMPVNLQMPQAPGTPLPPQ